MIPSLPALRPGPDQADFHGLPLDNAMVTASTEARTRHVGQWWRCGGRREGGGRWPGDKTMRMPYHLCRVCKAVRCAKGCGDRTRCVVAHAALNSFSHTWVTRDRHPA